MGIAAAGALVFAIAPLQRFAERVASRAVPLAQGGGPDTRESRYRTVLRRFLADGKVSIEEERVLAHLADDLGISSGRAFELRNQVRVRPR